VSNYSIVKITRDQVKQIILEATSVGDNKTLMSEKYNPLVDNLRALYYNLDKLRRHEDFPQGLKSEMLHNMTIIADTISSMGGKL